MEESAKTKIKSLQIVKQYTYDVVEESLGKGVRWSGGVVYILVTRLGDLGSKLGPKELC